MGWSCNRKAGFTLSAIQDFCYSQTGATNVFVSRQTKYMYEVGREQRDGSITAQVYRYLSDGTVRKTTSLKIDSDGKIVRGPSLFKKIPVRILSINNGSEFPTLYTGEVSEESLADQVKIFNDSYKVGGVNQHISESKGFIPFANSAKIVDINDTVLVEWKAGMFQIV